MDRADLEQTIPFVLMTGKINRVYVWNDLLIPGFNIHLPFTINTSEIQRIQPYIEGDNINVMCLIS